MPRQIIARLFLVCAMLLAQQTALAHALWHTAGAASAQDAKGPAGKKLCNLHDLLGTVLGALSAAAPHAELAVFCEAGFSAAATAALAKRPLVAQSRGPPAVS